MIHPRRRPPTTRIIRSAFYDRVPDVVSNYLTTLLDQAKRQSSEHEVGQVMEKIDRDFRIEHVPTRDDFEKSFFSGRAHPPEIKVDRDTDRVYLIGLGLPGREEKVLDNRRVKDPKTGDHYMDEVITTSEIFEDTVLTYTEASWPEYRSAHNTANDIPGGVAQAVCSYFDLPPHMFEAVVLATPSLSQDDYYRIGQYVLDPRTG